MIVAFVRKQLPAKAWVDYCEAWLAPEEASVYFAALREEVSWEQRSILAGDREVLQPRLMGWAGELAYRFSGLTLEPRQWTPAVIELKERLERETGVRYNHVVLNRYRDGRDKMGFHADDEPELGRNPVIASVSLGDRRRFCLRSKRFPKKRRDYNLVNGSLLVMGGTLQHTWYHAIERAGEDRGERINLTFRVLRGPVGWREPREPNPKWAESDGRR